MSALATATRRLRRRGPSPGRLRLSKQRMRLVVAATILCALLAVGGWLLLRDSSLVAVDHVTVTGVSGGDAAAITSALDAAAQKMTTLDFSSARLKAAVSGFPEVKGLRVTTNFPHGIVVHVIELEPVGAVRVSGREVAVTGEGVLLPKVPLTGPLPLIVVDQPPFGERLSQRWALGAVHLLAAAPRRLLPRLTEATTVAGHGLVVQIRNGPSVYFGDASEARAKWIALLAVLASPSSAGALYIDVTDPARPAAGAGEGAAQAAGIGNAAAMGAAVAGGGSAGTSSPSTGATSPPTAGTAGGTGTVAAGTTAPATGTTAPATGTTAPATGTTGG